VIKQLSDCGDHDAIYYTLNECNTALLARRAKNTIHDQIKETTSDWDIVRRRWFFIDFDPKRPKGVSSTKEEKSAAQQVMVKVVKALRKRGWPEPVIALSGNGYHLLFRVDQPNNSETTDLFKSCLGVIAGKFNSDAVEIDRKVFNASRITKAYGSLAAKGADTSERPHRYSRILRAPPDIGVVTRERLEALAGMVAGGKKSKKKASGTATTIKKIDDFLQLGEIDVRSSTETAGGGNKWILAVCPFNPEHTNDPAVFLQPDGTLGFKCFHASCDNQHWEQFRAAVEKNIGGTFKFGNSGGMEKPSAVYEENNGELIWRKATNQGEVPVQLTNFRARIVSDIIEDDGIDPKHVLEIEACCRRGKRTFCVPASEFTKMNWAIEKLGGEACIEAGIGLRDHARAAIQHLSTNIARRRVFLHTGFRKIGGQYFYLHAGGAIGAQGATGDISVRLPPSLTPFNLPEPPKGERLEEAIRASLAMLELGPARIMFPLYAAIWRAPLGPADFTIFPTGETGVFKTAIALLAQQHYGSGFDAKHLPANWNDTANANEALMSIVKDGLLLIDDFAPGGGQREAERYHRDAERILRSQGNTSGRLRMNRDTTLRPPTPPRGTVVSTGEDVPRMRSVQARALILDVAPGDIDVRKLTACQKAAEEGLFAEAMAAYVQYLASQYRYQQRRLAEQAREMRMEAAASDQHCRMPTTVANLAHGLFNFLLFAMNAGAIRWSEVKRISREGWEALGEAAKAQTRGQAAEEPTRRFMDLINAALIRGDVHLGQAASGLGPSGAKSKLIGWVGEADGQKVLLLEPEAAFAAANRLAQEQGGSLTVGQATMWKRMRERSLVVRHEKGRNLARFPIGAARRRVLCLRGDVLPFTDPEPDE
jgi:hypothetical protein